MKNPNPLIGKWQVIRHAKDDVVYRYNPEEEKKKIYIWFKNDSIYELRNEIVDITTQIPYHYAGDTLYVKVPNQSTKKTVVRLDGDNAYFSDADETATLKRAKEN